MRPTRVVVVADEVIVADHQRLMDKGKIRYDWRHYIPLLERKPGAKGPQGPLRGPGNGAPFADLPQAVAANAPSPTA